MAQVKKLQSGGASPSNTQIITKKRVYNGVELTDADLDKIVNDTAEFISKNSNYSEDIRGISNLSNKIKEEFKKGNMPEFDPTGTGLKIGDIIINAGKHNQNIFGNFSGDKLGREFAFRLKEGFDSYTKSSEDSQSTVSTTPTQKYHNGLARTISDRYFGGNWENAQKGIGELTPDKRLAYVKQGLKDSILKYKQEYGEDSKYSNRLSEIDAATPERIKEIAYEMGMDATDFLEGTDKSKTGQTTQNDPFYTLREYGEVIDDDYLRDKGRIGLKDKTTGKIRLFDRDDFSKEYSPEASGEIETTYGNHYGKGMFYDPNEGWKWGTKEQLAQGNLYNTVTQKYQEVFNKNKALAAPNIIDFRNTYDPVLTGLRDRETNSLNYNDISNQFNNLGENRVIVKDAVYDVLGNIDLQNSKIFYFDKAKNTLIPIEIDLNPTGPATARSLTTKDFVGQTFDLGAFGEGMNPTVGELGTSYSIDLGGSSKVDPNLAKRAIERVVGFQNKEITPDNVVNFYKEVVKKNFTDNLDGNDAKILANTILNIYNDPKFKVQTALSPKLLEQLKKVLEELRTKDKVETYRKDYLNEGQINPTVNSNSTNNYSTNYSKTTVDKYAKAYGFKKGGILKRQAGGGIQSKKIEHTPLTKMKSPAMEYGSARLKDVGTFSTSDTLDLTAAGLDAVSLVGGPVGIAAAGAATVAQSIADSKRYGFWSKENATGLGINLAFTLLAAVPGGGLLKAGKTASKAGKLGKLIGSSANPTIKASTKVEQAKNLLKVAEESGFKLLKGSPQDVAKLEESLKVADKIIKNADNPTKLNKFLNSKSVKAASNITRYSMIGLGATSGISSAGNIIEDVSASGDLGSAKISDLRGLVGGASAIKGVRQNLNQSRLRNVTESTIAPKNITTTIKFKNIPDEFTDLKKLKIGVSTTKEDALKTVKSNISSKINELEEKLKASPDNKDLAGKITLLKESLNKVDIDTNVFKRATESLKKSKDKVSGASSKFVRERIVGDWDTRDVKEGFKGYKFDSKGKLINGDDLKRSERKGLEYAKKMGYFEENPFDKAIKDLQNYKPDYSIKKHKVNVVRKPKVNVVQRPLALPPGKKPLALPQGARVMPKYSPSNPLNSIPLNQYTQSNPNFKPVQLSMFKQGGRLIPKFQKSGQLNWTLQNNDEKNYFKQPTYLDRLYQTQNSNLKNRLETVWNPNSPIYKSGESTETISGEQIKTPIYNTKLKGNPTPEKTYTGKDLPEITVTASKGGGKKTEYTPYKKRTLNIDPTRVMELAKLADAIGTNRKVSQKLRSVSPVMLQAPSEIYIPVTDDLASKKAVDEQVNSYLRIASKPFTSDPNLQKATQFEAMSKTVPLMLQSASVRTNAFNENLNRQRENSAKYAEARTNTANANAQSAGANEARLAQIGATELAVNKESRNAYADEEIKNYKEKAIRNYAVKNQLELNRLNTERTNKLKPYFEKYNNLLNDPKTSNVYTRAKAWYERFPDKNLEDYTENGKTYSELLALEQSNAQKVYEAESEKLRPYYETAMLNLRGSDPYSRTYSFGTYKKGGSIDPKVEIQNLKNKMKAKEINAKSDDKAKDRNERAVAAILKSMSKESLFLLKTMLGK